MSKFLKLIEENKPGEGPFTVEYKDKHGNLLATVMLGNDTGSSYENFLKFAEEGGGQLKVEDQESFLSKDEKDVLAVTSDLVKDPRRRSFQRDPKKDLERSYGDMIKKVAKKVKDVAKKIK